MVRSKENLIGAYAFLVGVILAVIVGLFNGFIGGAANSVAYLSLVVLGIVVGFLNFGDKDTPMFLLAGLALVIVSGQGNSTLIFSASISPILPYISEILSALLILSIPATIIVALKTVFSMAKI